MSYKNKVVWSEGMFLRPQHFQQQERYIESNSQRRVAAVTPFFWGFSTLDLDPGALGQGLIEVRRAQGVMPDGTPFDLEADAISRLAFDFPLETRGAKVCLVLPPLRDGTENAIYDEDSASAARFKVATFEALDVNALGSGAADIQIGRPRFRLMLEAEVPHGWTAMGLARVTERQPSNALRMDADYIPPTLDCGAQETLAGFVGEVSSLLGQRADALSGRLSAGGRGGVSEVGEFMVLSLINRWLPVMAHIKGVSPLHPERLYTDLISIAGEMASFSGSRRASGFPLYVHDDLQATFQPLMDALRRTLALVLDQTVVRIELQEHKYGIRLARIPDRTLIKQASFVLAAFANLPPDQVQSQFPAQIKIGPVEKIRDLVNLQLPGVTLRSLPVAPRELPFHAGYNYFEIDTRHDLWKEMEKSAGVALHIAGNFPGLMLECWAIRK
ncbi:MAG: type VI secretion system baseplate subunit TssK [Azoarcus sp.]|jgi:type VI secretion system protein ImpJ|nr:type VI secretion system baseplate subunit TssK [Azoarcus sp.]